MVVGALFYDDGLRVQLCWLVDSHGVGAHDSYRTSIQEVNPLETNTPTSTARTHANLHFRIREAHADSTSLRLLH
jgi:hypothetical protein